VPHSTLAAKAIRLTVHRDKSINAVVRRLLLLFASAAAVAAVAALFLNRSPSPAPTIPVAVRVPDRLSAVAEVGQDLFTTHCAGCHGEVAGGTGSGPPLVHIIYEPNHHGDVAFLLAVRNGVRAHHWRFGNMPPTPQISDSEITKIVRYIRELQVENGIGASQGGDRT